MTTEQATAKKQAARKQRATPWGQASLIEDAKVTQQAGTKRFSTVVELLESDSGERLVRIAYTTDGVARRGPVTLRARDLERLRTALAARSRLAEAFGLADGGA